MAVVSGIHAVVIGVPKTALLDANDVVPNCTQAVAAIAHYLRTTLDLTDATLDVLPPTADRPAVSTALDRAVTSLAGMGPSATLLLVFIGHGSDGTLKIQVNGASKTLAAGWCLATADVFSADDLASFLGQLPADTLRIVVSDACYGLLIAQAPPTGITASALASRPDLLAKFGVGTPSFGPPGGHVVPHNIHGGGIHGIHGIGVVHVPGGSGGGNGGNLADPTTAAQALQQIVDQQAYADATAKQYALAAQGLNRAFRTSALQAAPDAHMICFTTASPTEELNAIGTRMLITLLIGNAGGATSFFTLHEDCRSIVDGSMQFDVFVLPLTLAQTNGNADDGTLLGAFRDATVLASD
ncbi:MAG TPA: hypothetical protein VGM88_20165 [Kofleriaceae bacterium]